MPRQTADASKPAFKPRKVKKDQVPAAGPKYRDRAAERLRGEGNDYAQVLTNAKSLVVASYLRTYTGRSSAGGLRAKDSQCREQRRGM